MRTLGQFEPKYGTCLGLESILLADTADSRKWRCVSKQERRERSARRNKRTKIKKLSELLTINYHQQQQGLQNKAAMNWSSHTLKRLIFDYGTEIAAKQPSGPRLFSSISWRRPQGSKFFTSLDQHDAKAAASHEDVASLDQSASGCSKLHIIWAQHSRCQGLPRGSLIFFEDLLSIHGDHMLHGYSPLPNIINQPWSTIIYQKPLSAMICV